MPRDLTREQTEALVLLARLVMMQMRLRRQKQDLEIAIAEREIVERELRTSEGRFHAFMDNCPFLGFMKDTDGRMVYYNQVCADRFGVDRRQWLGRSDFELWPPEIASELRQHDLRVLNEWRTFVTDERADPSDGSSPHWRSYKFPFKDAEGNSYLAGFAVDVTEDKAAEEQLRRYQRALETANEQLASIASTDSLTGLKNRRAFEADLTQHFELARLKKEPLSLLLVDVDDFKIINDTFGHAEGDSILQFVSCLLQRSFRGTDVVARYGGEEFAVLLPSTDTTDALQLANWLCLRMSEAVFHHHRITISIGAASLRPGVEGAAEMVKLADDALYRAKRAGKNRVVVGDAPARMWTGQINGKGTSSPHRLL